MAAIPESALNFEGLILRDQETPQAAASPFADESLEMTATSEPRSTVRNSLRCRLISLVVLLIGLSSLRFTAYEQWSGPTPGWAATAFSFVGFVVFCDWIGEGAPGAPGPHDPDVGRSEMIACAAGLLANLVLVGGIVLGLFGAERLARRCGRIAVCLGLAAIVVLQISAPLFELRLGGYLWLGSMSLLAFSRLSPAVDAAAASGN